MTGSGRRAEIYDWKCLSLRYVQFQSLPIAIYGTKEENGNQFFPEGFYSWYWYVSFKGEPYPGAEGAAGGALWTEVSFEQFVKMQTIKILFVGV